MSFAVISTPFGNVISLSREAFEDKRLDLGAMLHPQERQFAMNLSAIRRPHWMMGRVCLRQATRAIVADPPPLLADHRGAPILPAGLSGSVSHKADIAVSLVALTTPDIRIGVDVEHARPSKHDISTRILTDQELAQLEQLPTDQRGRAVTLRFSIKEAIYKAIDPVVQRYVGFREVSLLWLEDRVVDQVLSIDHHRFAVSVWWTLYNDYWLTCASAKHLGDWCQTPLSQHCTFGSCCNR
jgi:4'-phosphopantetheinyl transferase EntD